MGIKNGQTVEYQNAKWTVLTHERWGGRNHYVLKRQADGIVFMNVLANEFKT
jgi:hypothetical protein